METRRRALAATLLSVAILLLASPYAAQMVAQTIYPPSGGGLSGITCSVTACTATVPIILPDGTAAAPSLVWSGASTFGFFKNAAAQIGIASAGTKLFNFQFADGFRLRDGYIIGWSSSPGDAGVTVGMINDGTNILQLGSDAATASANALKGPDSTGANVTGGALTLRAGAGTAGNATGGQLILGGGALAGSGERGAVAIEDGGTKPTCAAGIRGSLWYDAGAGGVADTYEVCAKSTLDAYAWRSIATIP